MMNDVTLDSLKDDLIKRKGEFWARKVVYFAGLRTAMTLLNTDDPVINNLVKLMSTDLITDLRKEFPQSGAKDLSEELTKDSELVINKLMME